VADIPVIVSIQGAQPTPPATLLADLIALVTSTTPGYTVLPGGLIDDISGTDVGALVICDSARVELLNSISPFVSNAFMLSQLGQVYLGPGTSLPLGPTNTSVFVVFQCSQTGFVIPAGFTVSDGTYQYVVQDGGVIASNGFSSPLFCLGTVSGSWAVPTGTVTQLTSSVPTGISLTCVNQTPGVPGGAAETQAQYRARVLQAGLAIGMGTQTLMKTLLQQVPNVQARLISTQQEEDGNWTIFCGGGDPYQTAYAIYASGVNISLLEGAVLNITAITQAVNGQITTAENHQYSPGQSAVASGIVGMSALNGVQFTVVSVVDERNFTITVNTTGFAAYVSGGVLSPNLNNISVSLYDYPNIYEFSYVSPPAQTVAIGITWATISGNFVSATAVAQAAQQPIADYVNSIPGGNNPISLLVIQQTFIGAVASILAANLISSLTISVAINGIATAPEGDLVYGDSQSYFTCLASAVTVAQAV
jgi:hypothetical protein